MKSLYKYKIEASLPSIEDGRRIVRYRLSTEKAGKKIFKVVGLGALTTMYHDGRIEGHIDQYIRHKLGLERRKVRSDRKRPVKIYVDPVAPKWTVPEVMYFYPDEWYPAPI